MFFQGLSPPPPSYGPGKVSKIVCSIPNDCSNRAQWNLGALNRVFSSLRRSCRWAPITGRLKMPRVTPSRVLHECHLTRAIHWLDAYWLDSQWNAVVEASRTSRKIRFAVATGRHRAEASFAIFSKPLRLRCCSLFLAKFHRWTKENPSFAFAFLPCPLLVAPVARALFNIWQSLSRCRTLAFFSRFFTEIRSVTCFVCCFAIKLCDDVFLARCDPTRALIKDFLAEECVTSSTKGIFLRGTSHVRAEDPDCGGDLGEISHHNEEVQGRLFVRQCKRQISLGPWTDFQAPMPSLTPRPRGM